MRPYEDPPKRVAIVGSRRFADPDAPDRARQIIRSVVGQLCHGDSVISGGAPGVDTWAAELAAELGRECLVYEPLHHRWEPNGYKARNTLIARGCTSLVAIRCADATSYGSGWTADLAQQLQKPVTLWQLGAAADVVIRYLPDGDGLDAVTPPV